MNLATKMLILAALLGAEIGLARCAHAHDHTVIAEAEDTNGSILLLTDTLATAEGPCKGKPVAVAVPPGGDLDKATYGCWMPAEDPTRVGVTYLLPDNTVFTDDYPKAAFTLTPYGEKRKAALRKKEI